jgi:hypothetical protein
MRRAPARLRSGTPASPRRRPSWRYRKRSWRIAPLGIIGASLALNPSGRPFGFVALLGLIALAGMIMRNTVILVDPIETDVDGGLSRREAIVEATVRRGGSRPRMAAIACSDRPVAGRLRELLRRMNACMCELGASEAKMHDMVEAAMNESWGVIRDHIDQVDEIITGVVADGVAAGEFDADPKTAGPSIRARVQFCHPANTGGLSFYGAGPVLERVPLAKLVLERTPHLRPLCRIEPRTSHFIE